jgi:hypothetical protein
VRTRGERQVLGYRQLGREALVQPALGDERHARPDELLGRTALRLQAELLAVDNQRAGPGLARAADRLRHRDRTRADQPGQPHDLALLQVEIESLDGADHQVPHLDSRFHPRVAVDPVVRHQVTAEHQPGEARLVGLLGGDAHLNHLAVAHHRDHVGHLDDFLKLVGDHQHRGTAVNHRLDEGEEAAPGRLAHRPGGLIEDNEPAAWLVVLHGDSHDLRAGVQQRSRTWACGTTARKHRKRVSVKPACLQVTKCP